MQDDMFPKIEINPVECNREVRTYGDVIRHMDDQELALFLYEMQANLELGMLAILRAKSYPHRKGGDRHVLLRDYDSMMSFLRSNVRDVKPDEYDVFGVDNWHDLCQWQWGYNPNGVWEEF